MQDVEDYGVLLGSRLLRDFTCRIASATPKLYLSSFNSSAGRVASLRGYLFDS